jgi:hypothetical protein
VVSQTVTTAWCTELGTTLLIGFENTTEHPAYFRCLNSFSVRQQLGPRQVPSHLVPPRGRPAPKEHISFSELTAGLARCRIRVHEHGFGV